MERRDHLENNGVGSSNVGDVFERVSWELDALDGVCGLFPSLGDAVAGSHVLGFGEVGENVLKDGVGERVHVG